MKTKKLINKKYFIIKGKKYKVKYLKDYKNKMPKDTEAIVYFDHSTIYIDDTLPDNRKEYVLIHELIHAILNECKLNLVLDNKIEELVVENICDLFFVLLKYYYSLP